MVIFKTTNSMKPVKHGKWTVTSGIAKYAKEPLEHNGGNSKDYDATIETDVVVPAGDTKYVATISVEGVNNYSQLKRLPPNLEVDEGAHDREHQFLAMGGASYYEIVSFQNQVGEDNTAKISVKLRLDGRVKITAFSYTLHLPT